MNTKPEDTTGTRVLRWIIRIFSIVTLGVILLFFFGETDFSQPFYLAWHEIVGLLLFPVGIGIGMIVGWRREGLGFVITAGSLSAFYVFQRLISDRFPRGPFFLLFASPGLLFGLVWVLKVRRSPTTEAP